jgi:murein peptide amidase A
MHTILHSWQQRYRVLGCSRHGRPLEAWHLGSSTSDAPCVLVMGAFHGDEPEGALVAKAWCRWLSDDVMARSAAQALQVVVVPVVNPDGLALKTRKNAWLVDINRNWPTQDWAVSARSEAYHGGPWPLSEPETQAMARLVTQLCPALIISFHTPYKEVNVDGPMDRVQPLAQAMATPYGYSVTTNIGYATPGSFGTWAGKEANRPVLTVELEEGGDEAALLADSYQAMLALLESVAHLTA